MLGPTTYYCGRHGSLLNGYYTGLLIMWSGFKPGWDQYCVPGKDALLSQCLSPLRCINGHWKVVSTGKL